MRGSLTGWLFDPSGLTPHGFCLLWEPWLIWTHAIADIGVGISYFTIPLALAIFAKRRRDLVFRPVFWLFAAFILLCGTGHWIDLLTLWVPVYGVQALVKAATAAVSIVTAVALWPLLPKALSLPSPAQMRMANAALREREQQARANFVRAPVPMHTLDAEGRITNVSDRWLELLGYTRAEAIGRHFSAFQEPSVAEPTDAFWQELMARGELRDIERRLVCSDGAVLDVLVSATLERPPDEDRMRVICALVDITGRKRAEAALRASEERLHHSQKMEAIGQLTGGIAHDFNNVLQSVMGSLQLMLGRLTDERPEIARLADNALEASGKAARLTGQLLSFARKQQLDPRPLNPLEVVENLRGLLLRTLGERITLRVAAEEKVGFCLADKNQLESALLNLVINARDAIAGSTGTVTISLRAAQVLSQIDGWPPPGKYVRMAVADDGPGMPPEVRCHAFEPFFTTKGAGKGTGLGLAQIHGFAHQSGGTATIESAVGEGTEVAILLPESATAPAAPAPSRECPAAKDELARGGGETILVVEDDAAVRRVLAETLNDIGYRTIEAEDADVGLRILEKGAAVDVVITDLAMPGSMDGLQFASLARQRHPGLPILLTTGHLDPFRAGGRLPDGVRFIQKPYQRDQLAAVLRQAHGLSAEAVGT